MADYRFARDLEAITVPDPHDRHFSMAQELAVISVSCPQAIQAA